MWAALKRHLPSNAIYKSADDDDGIDKEVFDILCENQLKLLLRVLLEEIIIRFNYRMSSDTRKGSASYFIINDMASSSNGFMKSGALVSSWTLNYI